MFSPPASPQFRIDAWASDYVGSVDLEEEDDAAPGFDVDTAIEPYDWSAGILPSPIDRPRRIVFVDGVQRIEVWGRVETESGSIDAALASAAVGAAVSYEGRAEITFDEPARVHRVFAVAGSVSLEPMAVRSGGLTLDFEPQTSAVHGRNGVSDALNHKRGELERRFAESLVDEESLVVLDGRLSFDPGGQALQVVGLAKTVHRNYLEGRPEGAILSRLAAGERTPVFRINYGATVRYSWYLRLPFTRSIHHSLAGIVRLETPEIGEAAAVRLADLTAFHLPAFASRPEHDPRAPQNLVPVGALEKRLRHEMGDSRWLRRTIEDYLYANEERA
jgi:hypothetical protein